MKYKPTLRIVQISDLHLFADPKTEMLGVNTDTSFLKVIEVLKECSPSPDFILLSGDLSQDKSISSYQRIAATLKIFPVPIYYIPGNHDDQIIMETVYPLENIINLRHIVLKQWQFILLDSHKPDAVEGFIKETELDFLENCLKTYPQHPAIICFHHHPIPIGSQWLDPLGVTNAETFWARLSPYADRCTVLFGHVHQECQGHKNGIAYYSAPSTCFQFKKNSKHFALDNIPPGYRWVDLYANSSLKTEIVRIKHYVGIFDKDSKGY